MREAVGGSVLQSWRALFGAGAVAGLEDGLLLKRFADRNGDAAEAAFAVLVARHGPMVRGVCRKVLTDQNDADDVFQATFLVLARKAREIRRPEQLANWLYGTALRAARRLRVDRERRRRHELSRPIPGPEIEPDRSEAAETVLEEVARLPRDWRTAVILCDLEGLTQDEAARRLGCSDRTLRRRLASAHEQLRERLERQGFAAPLAALDLVPELVPESLIDATSRLAGSFAHGLTLAGKVPAQALSVAEGVIEAMSWTRWKQIAALTAAVFVLGGGIGVGIRGGPGFAAHAADEHAKPTESPKPKDEAAAPNPTPAERYKALKKKFEDDVKVYQAEIAATTTEAQRMEIYKRSPDARKYIPPFVALAEEFPKDPVAIDALLSAVEMALSGVYVPDQPGGRAFARALELLARDYADEPRVGMYCQSLMDPSHDEVKEKFLRAVAGRSRNHAVKGKATLALADYLRVEAVLAQLFQHPDQPVDISEFIPADAPAEVRRRSTADSAAFRRQMIEFYSQYQPEYVKTLKQRADVAALRRESDEAFQRVETEFADVRAESLFGKPTRETLGDLARRRRQPGTAVAAASQFQPLAEAFRIAERKADAASQAVGLNEAGVKAYIAAAPKWADYGPKMWAIAESAPRSADAFAALLWIVRHHVPYFEAGEERAATLARAVDVLIRDHLDYIGDHLDDREVAEGFNHWNAFPAPHVDRLFRALYERGRTRDIRGRMGLMLARQRKSEADFAKSLELRGADPARRMEVAIFAPSYVEHLRKAGHDSLADESAALLEKVKAQYGDVTYVYGVNPTGETLATVIDRELTDIHTLAIGKPATVTRGTDLDGKPMALSEFQGKVVILNFGSHEHCGGCKLVYPKLRELVEVSRTQPLVVLGVNTHDRLATLRDLAARKEITWRCWWDGDDVERPGPITTRWNIRGYPSFVIIDHRGIIRYKDLYPADPQFDPVVAQLLKEAQAARP